MADQDDSLLRSIAKAAVGNSIPIAYREVLSWAPEHFVQSVRRKKEDEIRPDAVEGDWWPEYDDDDDTFRSIGYEHGYRTEEGRIYHVIHCVDTDGNWDIQEEAEVGTEDEKTLNEEYSYDKLQRCIKTYHEWVATRGCDPLGHFDSLYKEGITTWKFTMEVKNSRDLHFIKARSNHGTVITNHAALPLELRRYLALDISGKSRSNFRDVLAFQTQSREKGFSYNDRTRLMTLSYEEKEKIPPTSRQLKLAARREIQRLDRELNNRARP